MNETQRAAVQKALDVLFRAGEELRWQSIGQVKHELRAALAEQDVEPVAWWVPGAGPYAITADAQSALEPPWEPLYSAPPRREWVGLTDAEIAKIHRTCKYDDSPWSLSRAIEAALKEKNID